MTITIGRLKGSPLRSTQRTIISAIKSSSKRFIALNAPTGAGKSIIAVEAMPQPFFYLCSSKQLQDQLSRDFPEMAVLKGRNNYSCPIFDTADLCVLPTCDLPCSYKLAKRQAFASPMAAMNFHYFLHIFNYTSANEKRNIIIDEADEFESTLIDFISLSIDTKALEFYNIPFRPTRKTVLSSFLKFAKELQGYIILRHKELSAIISTIDDFASSNPSTLKLIKEFKWISSLKVKLELIDSSTTDNWVYYYDDRRIYLRPKWLTRALADKYFFSHGSKFLFMSATLPSLRVFCGLFGLSLEEVEYLESPSSFDIKNRPVYITPKWNLSRKTAPPVSTIRSTVKSFLSQNPTKGIIHTVNYSLANLLKDLDPRLIIHNSFDKEKLFQKFLASQDGVWVSPSSLRGIDLPGDLCRWIIFLKAPYADLSDLVTSARAYSGKFGALWYKSTCAQGIVQGAGRGVRNEKDWCKVYIFDEAIKTLIIQNASLFPSWFREAIVFE